MAYVRTFLVNMIPNDITLEQFRNSMEFLGSICRIDKTPYLSDDNDDIHQAWNAYIYYESWKSTEANLIIDENLENSRRKNTLCFIDHSGEYQAGHIDTELHTPTISVYPLKTVKKGPWFLCRNYSMKQFDLIPEDESNTKRLIRFIPEKYHLTINIPTKKNKTEWDNAYIMKTIQLFNIGDIVRIEKSKVLYDDSLPTADTYDTIVKVYLQNWYVSEFTMLLQDRIATHKKADIMIEFGEPKWIITQCEDIVPEFANGSHETWVRLNQHMYFD